MSVSEMPKHESDFTLFMTKRYWKQFIWFTDARMITNYKFINNTENGRKGIPLKLLKTQNMGKYDRTAFRTKEEL
jgi:hypothetical protein